MSLLINYLYEFGEFRLDIKERVLKQGNKPVALTPKTFELLCVFVENRGRLITKDELMEKIWADSFVEESNLTFNIRQLRKVLGDDAQTPRFIETVRLHGYRFIATVKEKIDQGLPKTEALTVVETGFFDRCHISEPNFQKPKSAVHLTFHKSSRKFSLTNLLLFLTIFGLITSVSIFAFWRKSAQSRNSTVPILAADFKSEKLTITGGVPLAVISPDGKYMAYSNNVGGKQSLWLRQLETDENIQLIPNSDEVYSGLNFSPDGETIYFARGYLAGPLVIYRISKYGGIPKEIVSGTQGWFGVSPDNRQISFVRCEFKDEDYCSLFVADINGQNERKLLTRPHPIRFGDNQFSPDGRSLAVAVGQSRNASKDFGLINVDLETGRESVISEQKFFNIKYLQWLPDQSGLLITAFDHFYTPSEIYEVSFNGGRVKQVTSDAQSYNRISFDRFFKKMIATQTIPNFRLWLGSPENAAAITPFYSAQAGFDFSRNGNVVYSSLSNGSNNIWMTTADGANQRQLTFDEGSNTNPIVSPDEKFIYFASNRSGSRQVWRMNADGSHPIQMSEGEGGHPVFVTPDGETIYYLTSINKNLTKITVQKDGTFSSAVVSQDRIWHAEIDPTGKTIAFFAQESGKFSIKLMSIENSQIHKTFSLPDEAFRPAELRWSSDGRSLYYLGKHKALSAIWKLSLETGQSEKFIDLGNEETALYFDLSADGKTVAFVRGRWLQDAVLVEGLN